ncbi:MAG: PIG-L family deacetylase [Lewinellaceae bacterium]|nr:PIG-L family deacetylase [Lewinellaceae bacterium]
MMLQRKHLLLFCLMLASGLAAWAQAPKHWSSAETYEAIRKLNFLGSALYVAAHPDDENTALIAYLGNEAKAEAAYLSLTRGDGGQNLIGPEIGPLLGAIRTQELLGARRIDGGRQFFSRAIDFGYSKNPDETLSIWNRDEVLADVAWAIRKWQPDLIITRFDHRTPGTTHGHHTASAMLANEAFSLAADPKAFPEQLKYVSTWQPSRLFYNTSWWSYGSREAFSKVDKSNMAVVDIGVYYPTRGLSNNELSSEARSMHKSQGFGSSLSRGENLEYLELIKGDMPADKSHLFDGINTSWQRLPGGEAIGKLLAEVESQFDFQKPYAVAPKLMKAYQLMEALPDGFWKQVKMEEARVVLQACLGLYLEASAEGPSATPGEAINLAIEAINRSPVDVTLESLSFLPMAMDTSLALALAGNQDVTIRKTALLPDNIAYTNAYWLEQPAKLGMYEVKEQPLRGLPETPHSLKVQFNLTIAGLSVSISKEVMYKHRDPVAGESYEPFEITPPVFTSLASTVYIFTSGEPQTVEVQVRAGRDNTSGAVSLECPPGWRAEPSEVAVELARKDEVKAVAFTLYPPESDSEGAIHPVVRIGRRVYHQELHKLDYPHIPTQAVLLDAQARAVRLKLEKAGERIGYIMGAGDDVPASLRQVGYEVVLLTEADMQPEQLKQFDAIVMGIRAYNTDGWLAFHQPALLEYVRQGGTLLVQYIKASRFDSDLVMPMDEIAPYPMKVGNGRVTSEQADMRFVDPRHPILNWPNEISASDFEGWVQERGLYFASSWDEKHYEPVFSCNDPGEGPELGSVLAAQYGKGYFIYTGLSFFRELPAGVPGAFRLFANMISVGKKPKP